MSPRSRPIRPTFVAQATSAVRMKRTNHPLIMDLWTREAWWTRTGLTVEQARALYTHADFNRAMKLWEIEAAISNGGSSSGSVQTVEDTEAAFQRLREQGGVHDAVYEDGDHGPADDRGDG